MHLRHVNTEEEFSQVMLLMVTSGTGVKISASSSSRRDFLRSADIAPWVKCLTCESTKAL